MEDPLAELITAYFELNGSTVDELRLPDGAEPGPLQFMRYVARNTPFVARGAAAAWPAVRTWSVPFLRAALADHTVNVAVTPNGLADAPTPHAGGLVFAKPWEEDQAFPAFLDHVVQSPPGAVRYAQTQNDNLRHEYAALAAGVPPDVSFARVALQRPPEAINLWIGNARSVTALHRDTYENVYVQVRGRKHVVLLPPLCQPCVGERPLAPYHYERRAAGSDGEGTETTGDEDGNLVLVPDYPGDDRDDDRDAVPFATWDPDRPDANATPYSHLARPLRVTLDPGDMLYLPAMWYHKVSQSVSDDGICVAVNYWYDMDFTGPLYSLTSFVRSVYQERTQPADAK